MPENDVFISYAGPDNSSLIKGQAGWVESFRELLYEHLKIFTGNRQVSVWFDKRKMDPLKSIRPAILAAVEGSRLMISVVSPSYITSDWCIDELNHFCTTKKKSGGLLFDDRCLLVKVGKVPVKAERLPEVFRELDPVGVEFYQPDGPDGTPVWFGLEEPGEARHIFISRVRSLAFVISEVLEQLSQAAGHAPAPAAPPPPGSYIYLARPTPDLKEDCARLKVELEGRGHRVYSLEGEGPPPSLAELERRVRERVRGCRLAIHMVGAQYGDIPKGDIRSYSYLENEYADEVAREADLPRLIFIPKGVAPEEKAQEGFLDKIRSTDWPGGRTEWLEGSFGEFIAVIDEKLKAARLPSPAPQPGGQPLVYVVFDTQDAAQGKAVAEKLKGEPLRLIGPTLTGDAGALAEAHRSKLNLCDAVLVVWDKIPDTWVHQKVADLGQAFGYGRDKPLRATAVLITGDPTVEKDIFSMPQGLVIKDLSDGTRESSLDEFVALLK